MKQIITAVVLLAACGSAFAANIPKHIVLVYTDAREGLQYLTKEDYVPLAAFVDEDGKPMDEMFDGFLISGLKAKSGNGLVPGFGRKPIQKEDYDWYLDRIFEGGKQIQYIDDVVESLPENLRKAKQIIITIPYPFEVYEHSVRCAMMRYFVNESIKRFARSGFKHLTLNGFYWIHETISGKNETLVKETAKLLHGQNYNFYWIPYYTAEGRDKWRECGFDCAMLQPNYAYSDVDKTRFADAEFRRAESGMTIELEIANYTRKRKESPRWRDSFLKYMQAGLEYKWGSLENIGYYNGNDIARFSRDKRNYPYYELIYKFMKKTLTEADINALVPDAELESRTSPATAE